ncbi:hypothetical protein VPH35_104916 [Triticum aestivum]
MPEVLRSDPHPGGLADVVAEVSHSLDGGPASGSEPQTPTRGETKRSSFRFVFICFSSRFVVHPRMHEQQEDAVLRQDLTGKTITLEVESRPKSRVMREDIPYMFMPRGRSQNMLVAYLLVEIYTVTRSRILSERPSEPATVRCPWRQLRDRNFTLLCPCFFPSPARPETCVFHNGIHNCPKLKAC